jgi:hypothetical protein
MLTIPIIILTGRDHAIRQIFGAYTMSNTNKTAKPARRVNGKAAAKPEAKAPVAKPAAPAAADQRAERQALTDKARATVRAHYNGASLTVHAHRAPKLADCIARIKAPTCGANSASKRDESLLLLIASATGGKPGAFNPASPELAADLGVISRLASLGFIAAPGDQPTLTDKGAQYAKAAAKAA